MLTALIKFMKVSFTYRFICAILSITFVATTMPVSAQVLPYMPPVGSMVAQSAKPYSLPYIVGMQFSSNSIFDFTFFFNRGDAPKDEKVLRPQVEQANKYFLAALTIPEKDLWVNLSPYEANRIITPELSRTDLGKDLLGEDYVLKQLASSLTHPDTPQGKAYWNDADFKSPISNIKSGGQSSLAKVWIIPGTIKMQETSDRVVITEATLKVMTDEDYLARQANTPASKIGNLKSEISNIKSAQSAEALQRHIIPLIEKEVNTGKHFSQLRQAYYSIIMAGWFKKKLKDTVLNQIYFNQKKTTGAENNDPALKEKIYNEYVKAFNQGVYKVIKQDHTAAKISKRTYFCGGARLTGAVDAANTATRVTGEQAAATTAQVSDFKARLGMNPERAGLDNDVEKEGRLRGLATEAAKAQRTNDIVGLAQLSIEKMLPVESYPPKTAHLRYGDADSIRGKAYKLGNTGKSVEEVADFIYQEVKRVSELRVAIDAAIDRLFPVNNFSDFQQSAIHAAHLIGDGNIGNPEPAFNADGTPNPNAGKYLKGTYDPMYIQAKLSVLQAAGIEGVTRDDQGKLRIVTGSPVDKLMRGDGVNPPATGNKPGDGSGNVMVDKELINNAVEAIFHDTNFDGQNIVAEGFVSDILALEGVAIGEDDTAAAMIVRQIVETIRKKMVEGSTQDLRAEAAVMLEEAITEYLDGQGRQSPTGGFDFATTSVNTKIDVSSDGGFKASAQKATAYLANGKLTGFKLAIVALNY